MFKSVVLVVVCWSTAVESKDCATQSCLTDLYNSRVTYAWLYKRALGSSSSISSGKRFITDRLSPGLYHAGVVVEVDNGDRWLIHKGKDYGDSSDTVITDASYMSSAWELVDQGSVFGHTVDDFMQAAYVDESYSLLGPNCQTAANGMWNLVD